MIIPGYGSSQHGPGPKPKSSFRCAVEEVLNEKGITFKEVENNPGAVYVNNITRPGSSCSSCGSQQSHTSTSSSHSFKYEIEDDYKKEYYKRHSDLQVQPPLDDLSIGRVITKITDDMKIEENENKILKFMIKPSMNGNAKYVEKLKDELKRKRVQYFFEDNLQRIIIYVINNSMTYADVCKM